MQKTISIQDSIEKEVVSFGNGSIVYTPKKWIGKKVLVVLEEKPLDIEGDVLELLKPYLSSVEGIYLYGSHARNEQTKNSDIDILIISNKNPPLKKKGNYDFLIKSKESLINELKSDPNLFLYQIISEARPILNQPLLEELKRINPAPDLTKLLDSTLSAFKSTSVLLTIDHKKGSKYLSSPACIYSLILRMRTLFLAQCFLKNKPFSTKNFKSFLSSHSFSPKLTNSFLETYRAERDGTPAVHGILLKDAEKLFEAAKLEFLKTEELIKKRKK